MNNIFTTNENMNNIFTTNENMNNKINLLEQSLDKDLFSEIITKENNEKIEIELDFSICHSNYYLYSC